MSHLKLTSVEIRGFRRFREPWKLDLHSPAGEPLPYLVLAGPNGSGKTSVLEAILLALGREELIGRDEGSRRRFRSHGIETPSLLRIELHDRQSGFDYALERSGQGVVVWGNDNQVSKDAWGRWSWDHCRERLAMLRVEYISSRRVPALLGPVRDTLRPAPAADAESNRIARFKQRVRQQQGRRVPGYKGPDPLDEAWLSRLNAFWREFRDDGTALTMTLVDPGNLDVSEWDLFLYRGDERLCSVDRLSSGEQEVIATAVPFITEPFDGLLLFDEPELHLHPRWQGRLLRALRKLLPEAQIVVATHADDPWDDAMSWERVLLTAPSDSRVRSDDGPPA